jgi:hypothetical protein
MCWEQHNGGVEPGEEFIKAQQLEKARNSNLGKTFCQVNQKPEVAAGYCSVVLLRHDCM